MRICKVQGFTDWAKSVKSRALQNPGWFGRTPTRLLIDNSISSGAKVAFGILAAKTYKTRAKTDLVTVSTRELAELLATSATTISTWMKELRVGGYVEKVSGAKAKSAYKLLSPVFKYRVRVETAPDVITDVDSSNLPMLRDKRRTCPKCKRMRSISSTSGVCAACLEDWAKRSA